jgi:diadenylate cyclase
MAKRTTNHVSLLFDLALRWSQEVEADAILIWATERIDPQFIEKKGNTPQILLATTDMANVQDAVEAGLDAVVIETHEESVLEQIGQALLECIADDLLSPRAGVVVVYNGIESGQLDSISYMELDEHLERLSGRDLRQLGTNVPLDTLRTVVDLAVDIGREGREGKPVGTMFVVGDARKVLTSCRASVFDPMRGYQRRERNLRDPKVREGIKELAQLDGAFIVASDGTVEAACQIVQVQAVNITLSKGLGARHWAAAAISKNTSAIAVTVSESSGTVRIFQNGEVMLRIEPFRRAMKWKDFERS